MKKGFTLVELMVIIAIIGILALALFPSVHGYLARARDTAKKNDLNQIQSAIETYYTDKNIYAVSGGGWLGLGNGWANYSGPSYPSSITTKLTETGYLGKDVKQKTASNLNIPVITTNRSPCTGTGRGMELYMFYTSTNRYSLSAYLENPTDKNISDILVSHYGSGADGTCTFYGRNYAVGN